MTNYVSFLLVDVPVPIAVLVGANEVQDDWTTSL